MFLNVLNSMPRFKKSQIRAAIMPNYLVVLLNPQTDFLLLLPSKSFKICREKRGQPNEDSLMCIVENKASFRKKQSFLLCSNDAKG